MRRTERLNKITAAIAAAVTADDVFEAVVDQVGAALEAGTAALWLVRDKTACLARASGYSEPARRLVESMPLAPGGTVPVLDSIRTGEPVWIASQEELLEKYPQLAAIVTPGRSYRIACLPIATGGQPTAALAFTFDDARRLDDDERSFLLLVARFTGQALERVRLLAAEHASRARAELLYGLAAAANRAERSEEVFEAALDAMERAFDTKRASILMFDSEGVMRFSASRGLSDEYRRAVEGHSPWSRETRNPRPICIGDVDVDPSMATYLPQFRSEGIGALCFIPLKVKDRLIGKVMVYHDRPHEFGHEELDLAEDIASHVAAAISRFANASALQQTVRLNEMFTGILAHDLRNPLAAMVTAANLALTWNESQRLVKPLSRIVTSGARMSRMIDQLLDFTRIRLNGGMPLVPEASNLLHVVRQAMDELDDANPDWTLQLESSGDTRGMWDADRLSQVFSNLIANAIQHGGGERRVDVTVDGRGLEAVVIKVQNPGTIPAQIVPSLFEPLAGGGRSMEKSRGLGLGLYITREIVRAHGGRIDVQSDDVIGTTITVVLPRSPAR